MRLIPPSYSVTYSVMDYPESQRMLLRNGGIPWILLSVFLAIVPTLMLPIGVIPKIVVILVVLLIPVVGEIIQFVSIIWGLVVLFTSTFTILSLLFIVAVIAHFWFVFSPFFANNILMFILEHRR